MCTGTVSPTLRAGAARVDITPPLTIPELGWLHARHTFFHDVHDPLFARAVVVDDGARRVALCVADSIGIRRDILGPNRDFMAEVRQRVGEWTGIEPDHIMIAATHAHSTPELIGFRPMREHRGAPEWLEVLADQLASAITMADRRKEPVRLKRAVGTVEGVGWSRRIIGRDGRLMGGPVALQHPDEVADWGANDHELTMLTLETLDGRPKTVLMHFTTHPVTVQVNPKVSADFPGAATAFVQGAGVGCEDCIYIQGACGSINPVRATTDFADVARYGQTLGGEAIKRLGLIAAPDYPTCAAVVGAATETIMVPSRPLPDLAEMEAERERLEAILTAGRAEGGPPTATEEQRKATHDRLLSLMEQLARVRRGSGPFEAPIQALRIGDTALVGIPAEPFCELGLAIKQIPIAPSGRALCVGYANDYLGYVAPGSAWEQGGYEVSLGMWAWLGPEAFELMLEASRRVVGSLFGDRDGALLQGGGSPPLASVARDRHL